MKHNKIITTRLRKGKNAFIGKQWPFNPFFRNELHYRFKLGPEWWENDMVWTSPITWGCKLMTVGRAPSYHRGGMNMGMTVKDGNIVLYPRYYGRRKMYTENKLHELSQFPRVIMNQEKWVDVRMVMKPTMQWWVNGEKVHEIDQDSPTSWFHWMYLGRRGWDLNYPGYDLTHNKVARAERDLTVEVEFFK